MAMDHRLSMRQLRKLVQEQGVVLQKDPTDLVARQKLAEAHRDLGEESEALTHYLELARAYADAGRPERAISVYQDILAFQPGHRESELALAELSSTQPAPSRGSSSGSHHIPPDRVNLPPEPPASVPPPPPPPVLLDGDDDADFVLLAEEPSEDERYESDLHDFDYFEEEEITSPGPTGYDETIRKSARDLEVGALEARLENPPSGATPPPRHTLLGVPPAEPGDPPELLSMPIPKPGAGRRTVQMEREPDFLPVDSIAPGEPVTPGDEETLSTVFDHEEEALWNELESSPRPRRETSRAKARPTLRSSPAPPPETTSHPKGRAPGDRPREGKQVRQRKSSKMTIPMGAAAFAQAVAEHEGTGEQAPTTERIDGEVRLEEIALFRDLSETSREMLRSRMVRRLEEEGATIVREGDPGNALFVVGAGRVKVTKLDAQGQLTELATLGPGAFFGEFALLSDRKRHATVTVCEGGVFYEISRKVISDLTKSDPSFGNTLRQFYRRRLLETLVRSAPFFDPLGPEERDKLMARLRFRRIPESTRIITEGEPGGGFFLILIGEVEVTRSQPDGSERILSRLADGSYFGEMSLLKGGNAVATVTAVSPTEIVQLAAAEFYRILSKYPQIWEGVNREAKRRELANLEILAGRAPGIPSDDGVVL